MCSPGRGGLSGAWPRLCEVDVGQWPTYVLSWAPLLEGKINHCPLCGEEGAKKVALGWAWKRCLPGSISVAPGSMAPESSWLCGGPNEGVDGFLQQQPWPLEAWTAQAPRTCRGGGRRPPILACFAPFCASMGDRSLVCPGDRLSEQVSMQKEGVPTPWTPCPGRPPTLPSGGHGCSSKHSLPSLRARGSRGSHSGLPPVAFAAQGPLERLGCHRARRRGPAQMRRGRPPVMGVSWAEVGSSPRLGWAWHLGLAG